MLIVCPLLFTFISMFSGLVSLWFWRRDFFSCSVCFFIGDCFDLSRLDWISSRNSSWILIGFVSEKSNKIACLFNFGSISCQKSFSLSIFESFSESFYFWSLFSPSSVFLIYSPVSGSNILSLSTLGESSDSYFSSPLKISNSYILSVFSANILTSSFLANFLSKSSNYNISPSLKVWYLAIEPYLNFMDSFSRLARASIYPYKLFLT